MKFFNILAATAALSASISLASPLLDEKRDLVCLAQTIIINLITLNHGEAFCSAYLGIQTSTIRTTTTKKTTTTQTLPPATVTTTVVTGTQTQTLTSLSTTLATATSTIDTTQTFTATNTITITSTTTGITVKRSPEPLINGAQIDARDLPTIPPYLSIFAASKISSACSCLSLSTPSTTVTSTVQQTSTTTSTPPAVTSQVQIVTFVTVTTTAINTITEVQTLTNTISTTTTATTTTTVIIIETLVPSYCDQTPIPGPYARDPGGPAYVGLFSEALTKVDSCRGCWDKDDCVSFSFQIADPNEPAFCTYYVSEGPAESGIPIDIFFVGPCDLASLQYVNGG